MDQLFPALPAWSLAALTILGMAAVTLVSRTCFLWSKRDMRLPEPLQRALQVAPLAAIVAVLAPEIFMSHGELIGTWRDARLPAALATTLVYAWRSGVLLPLLAGLAVYMPLHVGLGW